MRVSRLASIPGIGVDKVGDAADAAADPEILRLENLDTDLRPPAPALIVRRAVDDGAPGGSFLLTGSPPAPGTTTHSGAGRIVVVRMRPLSLAERATGRTAVSLGELLQGEKLQVRGSSETSLTDYVDEITRSGFPGFRDLTDRSSRAGRSRV